MTLTKLDNCPRCGETHVELNVKELKRYSKPSPECEFGNWSICPNTMEPILLGLSRAQKKAREILLELSLAC